jgi:translation elongation factor EF-4
MSDKLEKELLIVKKIIEHFECNVGIILSSNDKRDIEKYYDAKGLIITSLLYASHMMSLKFKIPLDSIVEEIIGHLKNYYKEYTSFIEQLSSLQDVLHINLNEDKQN